MLNLGLDLFALTYKPNSILETAFNDDLEIIRTEKIAKLSLVTDENTVIYIPEHFFDTIPDGSVQKYFRLGLAIELGIFDDADQLSTIRNEVEQIVESMAGVANKTVIYTVSNKWLTTTDYADLDAARQAAITRVRNHYTDKLALQKEVDSLRTLIGYYENALKSGE